MKQLSLVSICLACFFQISAQHRLTGTIVDEQGSPLIGANVYLAGTYDGASTDQAGNFSFPSSETGTQTLIASYIGFEKYSKSITLTDTEHHVDISLKSDASQMDPVVITAGVFEASDEKKSVILNSLDIVTTAGSMADIPATMNTLPGTQTVGETGGLFVRGGASYETRTFVDGLDVLSPFYSNTPDVPSRGRFSPFLFKGTVFSTGGYSAEYGQALSSALILNSKDLAQKTESSISLMSVGGEIGHTQAWKKSSVSLTGNYSNLSPYFELIQQGRTWDKVPETYSGTFVFRHKPKEGSLVKVFANYEQEQLGLSLPFSQGELTEVPYANINQNIYVNSTYKSLLGQSWVLKAGFAFSNYTEDMSYGQFDVSTHRRSIHGKAVLSRAIGEHGSFKMGASILSQRFDEVFTDNTVPSSFPTLLDDHMLAGFSEAEFHVNKSLALRIGVRGEHSSLTGYSNIAPRFSSALKTGKHSQLSFAAGQFFQRPEFELMRFTQDLRFEGAQHYILNFQRIKNQRTFRAELFAKNYQDLVLYNGLETWLGTDFRSEGSGYACGIDIFWRDQKSIKNTDYWVSYSFLDTERAYRNFPYAVTPHFASKHNFSLVGKHFISKLDSQLGFTFSYTSPRPYHNPNLPGYMQNRTPAFKDVSFNWSYLTLTWDRPTIIHFAVSNVLGFNNIFGYRYATERNAAGNYGEFAIRQPAKRFFFLGIFITLGSNSSSFS